MPRPRPRFLARIRPFLSLILVFAMLLGPRSGVRDTPSAPADAFTFNPLALFQPLIAHAAGSTVNVQGDWVGSITINGQGTKICTFSVSQNGATLGGGGTCASGESGSCSGTLTDAAMSLVCQLSGIGSLQIDATISTHGTTASGTWKVLPNGPTGSYLAIRQDDPSTIFGHLPYVPFGGDPANLASGGYFYRFGDLTIPTRGSPLVFSRAYNSQDTSAGPFGPGWTHRFNVRLLIDASSTPPRVSVVNEEGNHDIYFQNADGSYSNPPGVYAALVHNGDGTYTLTRTNHDVLTFDANGRLTGLADQNGNTTTLSYNGNGEVTTIADPDGRGSLTLAYDTCFAGRLCSVTDWLNPARTVSFGYDASGRLQTVTDRNGKVTTYAYDASNRLTTITDANNHQAIFNIYDSAGRIVEQHDAKTLASCVYYSTAPTYTSPNCPGPGLTLSANQTLNVDRNGNKTLFTYDSSFRTTQILDAANGTTAFGYDSNNNQISVTDPLLNTTNRCFDTNGNLTRLVDPPSAVGQTRPVTVFAYNGFDLIQTTLPKGVTIANPTDCSATPTLDPTFYSTWNTYDAKHNLTSVTRKSTDPDLGVQTAITKFEYNDASNPGALTKVIPPRGNTGPTPDYSYATSFAYYASGSQAGMLQSTTDPLGNVTTATYDAVGRRLTTVDPNGNVSGANPAEHTWKSTYDNEDRPLTVSAPAPAATANGAPLTTTYQYDPVGNRTVVIDANGQVTKSLYDERDSLARVLQSPLVWTDPGNPPPTTYATVSTYDNNGNRTRITRDKGDAPNERATDYSNDALNRLHVETQYPAWRQTTPTLLTTATYDANGNLHLLLDPLGQTTTYGYDNLNRLSSISYSDGITLPVSFTYDLDGNRATLTTGTATTQYTYDELDRLIAVTSPGNQTVGYRYDLDGHRTKVIYPDTTAVTDTFDKAGQLQSLSDWNSRQVRYQYDPAGNLKQATNPDGTTATFSYDNALRLTQVLNQNGATTISQHAYTLDKVGNRTQVAETLAQVGGGTSSLTTTYGYDQLYELTNVNNGTTTYTYDPAGNRLTKNARQYAYDKADRLQSVGQKSYTVNDNGNLIARGTDSFAYDQANRLTSATVSGATSSYTYDGDGKRTSKTVGGVTTTYVYDVNGSLPNVLTDGTLKYVYGLGLAYAVDGSNNVQVYHTDGLGSVRAITDGNGNLIATYQTDEFGVPTQTQGTSTQPFQYTGQQNDPESGLYYLRARMYDPSIGRFFSRDPFVGVVSSPLTLNRYSYVLSNPLSRGDANGLGCNSGEQGDCYEGALSSPDVQSGIGGGVPNESGRLPINFETFNTALKAISQIVRDSYETLHPGPNAHESIPARSYERNWTTSERNDMNRIGNTYGCHTCSAPNPGKSSNWVPDHQPPSAFNPDSQRLYPHCRTCSSRQGSQVRQAESEIANLFHLFWREWTSQQ